MRHWALIAAAYLVGSLIFLWPMPSALDSAVWGDRFDAWTTLWLIGHLAEGMESGTLSAHTTETVPTSCSFFWRPLDSMGKR